jgi:hypothetical protein
MFLLVGAMLGREDRCGLTGRGMFPPEGDMFLLIGVMLEIENRCGLTGRAMFPLIGAKLPLIREIFLPERGM